MWVPNDLAGMKEPAAGLSAGLGFVCNFGATSNTLLKVAFSKFCLQTSNLKGFIRSGDIVPQAFSEVRS